MAQAEMWGVYEYRGHRVRVIQLWSDPFGVRMVRIEMEAEDDDRAEGMSEEAFLGDATPCPSSGAERS